RPIVLAQISRSATLEPRGRRHRLRPQVGRLPMIWKELFIEPGFRLTRMGRLVVYLLVALSFSPAIWVVWNAIEQMLIHGFPASWAAGLSRWDQLGNQLNPWVRIAGTAVASLLLVGVAVRASTSIGGERDRDTLDPLLASPLYSNDILLAKWLGSVVSVRW